ncbi:MAG TPA: response regulator [Polyangiales bacterium]|nr:response regulator [Polyangiales bacterium]
MAIPRGVGIAAGDLAANVAHEINNPLTVVIANLDVALHQLAELSHSDSACDAIAERLKDARHAAERIHHAVRGIASAGSPSVPPPRRESLSPLSAADETPVRRARVLVVDDEQLITTAVQRTLSLQHDVRSFDRAQAAFECMSQGERFDVILCDLMMPDMSGMELHAWLSRIAPDQAARMVFLTGGIFTSGARAFLAAVPNAHIEKPFDTHKLRLVVNGCLRRHDAVT